MRPEVPERDPFKRMLQAQRRLRLGSQPKMLRPTLDTYTDPGYGSPVDADDLGGTFIEADIANNSNATFDLADSTRIRKAVIEYHADRGTKAEHGKVVLWLSGAGAAKISRCYHYDDSTGHCALTMAASLSGVKLRLTVTSDNSANTTEFRANYTVVRG